MDLTEYMVDMQFVFYKTTGTREVLFCIQVLFVDYQKTFVGFKHDKVVEAFKKIL